MMRRTFGAPLRGAIRGGHQGVDCAAFSLITPPNFGSGCRKLPPVDRGGAVSRAGHFLGAALRSIRRSRGPFAAGAFLRTRLLEKAELASNVAMANAPAAARIERQAARRCN